MRKALAKSKLQASGTRSPCVSVPQNKQVGHPAIQRSGGTLLKKVPVQGQVSEAFHEPFHELHHLQRRSF